MFRVLSQHVLLTLTLDYVAPRMQLVPVAADVDQDNRFRWLHAHHDAFAAGMWAVTAVAAERGQVSCYGLFVSHDDPSSRSTPMRCSTAPTPLRPPPVVFDDISAENHELDVLEVFGIDIDIAEHLFRHLS